MRCNNENTERHSFYRTTNVTISTVRYSHMLRLIPTYFYRVIKRKYPFSVQNRTRLVKLTTIRF